MVDRDVLTIREEVEAAVMVVDPVLDREITVSKTTVEEVIVVTVATVETAALETVVAAAVEATVNKTYNFLT